MKRGMLTRTIQRANAAKVTGPPNIHLSSLDRRNSGCKVKGSRFSCSHFKPGVKEIKLAITSRLLDGYLKKVEKMILI